MELTHLPRVIHTKFNKKKFKNNIYQMEKDMNQGTSERMPFVIISRSHVRGI